MIRRSLSIFGIGCGFLNAIPTLESGDAECGGSSSG